MSLITRGNGGLCLNRGGWENTPIPKGTFLGFKRCAQEGGGGTWGRTSSCSAPPAPQIWIGIAPYKFPTRPSAPSHHPPPHFPGPIIPSFPPRPPHFKLDHLSILGSCFSPIGFSCCLGVEWAGTGNMGEAPCGISSFRGSNFCPRKPGLSLQCVLHVLCVPCLLLGLPVPEGPMCPWPWDGGKGERAASSCPDTL